MQLIHVSDMSFAHCNLSVFVQFAIVIAALKSASALCRTVV